MKNTVNLSGFCEVQKLAWQEIKEEVETNLKCLKCKGKLVMVSKWEAKCIKCGLKHSIEKPKSFPKDKNNWKSTCIECGGVMDYYEKNSGGAYICRKCNSVLEV